VIARVYRWLLRAYPRGFRRQFGEAMHAEFLADARASRDYGLPSALWFYAVSFAQALGFGALERFKLATIGVAELRYVFRSLRSRRWTALATITLLSVAMALATVAFSLADSYLFNRAPYPNAGRLVELRGKNANGVCCYPIPADVIGGWRTQTDLLSEVHVYQTGPVRLSINGVQSALWVSPVTPGMLEMLGARARWGRLLREDDVNAGATIAIVLGEEEARKQFGTAEDAIGKAIAGAPQPMTVVGVVPAAFRFIEPGIKAWRATSISAVGLSGATNSYGLRNFAIARMAPGLRAGDLNSRLAERLTSNSTAIDYRLTTSWPLDPPLTLKSADAFVMGLVGAAWCLLLAAWAAVGGIEVAGTSARLRRVAIQLSLGASRARLAIGASVEILLVYLAAITGAIVLSQVGLSLLSANGTVLGLSNFGSLRNIVDFDSRAVLFLAGISLISWLGTLVPVLLVSRRADPIRIIGKSSRSFAGGADSVMRRGLTVVQVGLAVALMSFAALCIRTYVRLDTLDKGFDPENLVVAKWQSGTKGMTANDEAEAVMARLSALREVESVALAGQDPFDMRHGMPFAVEFEGRPQGSWGYRNFRTNHVQPGYFATMRLPILRGRDFQATDSDDTVIVSEAFARKFSPDSEIVGARVRLVEGESWRLVLGVVANVRHSGDGIASRRPQEFEVYEPFTSTIAADRAANLIVRFRSPNAKQVIREFIRDVDPKAFVFRLDLMTEIFGRQIAAQRSMMHIATVFGVLSLVVAIAGLFAVMSALVTARTREIGIRVALGATLKDVRALVFGASLRLIAAGAVIGVAVAIAGAKYVSSVFYGVTIADPITHLSVAALLGMTAVIATWQPTRRAARIDPAITLRDE
jgi:predicted permease